MGTRTAGPSRYSAAAGVFVALALLGSAAPAHAQTQVLTFTPTSPHDHGSVDVGANGVDEPFTIENTGGDTLTITGFALSGADCARFDATFPSSLPVLLAGGETVGFTIGFNPIARGPVATCNVVVTSDDGDIPGTLTNIAQDGTGIAGELTVSQTLLAFGSRRIGAGPSSAMTFDIDNVGENPIDITDVALGGADLSQFVLSGWGGFTTLAPADPVITISITFDPSSTGAKVANVLVQSTDPVTANETVNLTGTGTSALISVPATIDHADVVRNTTNNETLTITNAGTVVLTLNSVVLSGADASHYSLGAIPPTVAAGSFVNITVSCTPTSVGTHSNAAIDIDSDADSASPDPSVALLCNGVKPDITLNPNLNDISFGSVLLGQSASPTQTKTVVNANLSTTSSLTFNVALSGPNANNFSVSPASCISPLNCIVVRNGSRVLTFGFTPSAVGLRTATATITSDDQETPSLAFGLSGTGIRPELSLILPAIGSHNFGDVDVGGNSSNVTIRVQNTGTANVAIDAVTLGGANPTQFSIQSGSIPPPNISLVPGAIHNWTVRCQPTTQGNKSATFRIDSNDAVGNDPINVALSCRGVESQLDITPAPPLDFGDVRLGESAVPEMTVTLTNSGNLALDVTAITLSPSVFFFSTTNPPPVGAFQLAANGGSVQFDIGFTPVLNQQYNGTLQIETAVETRLVTVQGYGRLAELSITPTSYDFGDVDICTGAGLQTFTVENTGDGDWRFVSVSQGNPDFAIDQISQSPNAVISPAETVTFRVTATPAAVGTTLDTILFQSDIPNGTMSLISIQATGISNDIQLSSNAVDFGQWDVQDVAGDTRSVTITNPGDSPLTVTDLDIAGLGAAAYTLGVVALPVTIQPGGVGLAVPITFLPVVESVGEPPASLFITSDAACGAVSEVPLSGLGIDRHISTNPGQLEFGEAYRNPIAPVELTLDIGNTGLANLNISMVSPDLTGSPFRLLNAAPMQIGPTASQQITVLFSPTAIAEFTEQLIINNDDSDQMMSIVTLHGFGVSRNVTLSHLLPIDMGTTGVGIPARVSAVVEPSLRLISMNPNDSFTVREIRLVDPDTGLAVDADVFEVIGIGAGDVIDPMGTLEVEVEVTPTVSGRFVAVIEVYLDEDPLVVTFVEISGEAVDVQVRGGGCDAAGGGSGAGSTALLIGLVLLGLAGRRRVRLRLRGAIPAALVGLCIMGTAAVTHADATRNIEVQTFRPAPSVEGGMLAIEMPEVGVTGAWAIGLTLNQTMNPINLVSAMRPGLVDQPITSRTVAELGFAYALAGRYEVGGLLPIMTQSGDQPMFSGLAPAEGTALGDLAVHGKAFLLDSKPLSFGASATLTLPTGRDGQFAGVDGVSLHLRGITGVHVGRIVVGINGGIRFRGTSELGDVDQGNELTYGLAGAYRVLPKLSAIGELFGAFGLGAAETTGVSPLEWMAGVRYRASQQISVSSGIGWGLMAGIGAPDFRGFLHITYSPKASAIEPFPVTSTGPEVVVDNGDDDNDGVINSDDQCPDEKEDVDDWADDDGCPDLDNDEDGLADSVDPCPNEAEDADGFKDDDGCPDLDNDEDKIPDVDDKCPNEPEDKDGYEDLDGCDDPDNDNDGIPDVIDQCALEAEVINGNNDDDGCPDDGESLVMVMADRMELFEGVKFKGTTAVILKKSNNVLGQIAATMRANRDFLRVRIAVHVHPRNNKDDDLSRRRAEAIRVWLTGWGIEPERLDVAGYGSSRPLVDKSQRGAAEINDRVEFIILEKKVK